MNVQNITREATASKSEVPRFSSSVIVPQIVMRRSDSAAYIISTELLAGLRAWQIWTVMSWDDIRQRYRRSVLGPFWITLSMGFFILILGVIYSRLFHTPLEHYMPYLTVGYIVWGFISSTTSEACNVFYESAGIIKQIKLPYSIYVMRVIWRNFIVFLHTIVIYLPVALYFKVAPSPLMLLVLPGLLLLILNQIWVTIVIGILATRYRDMLPIIGTTISLLMFATPIMWMIGSAKNLETIANINPVYHLIDIIRAPALGMTAEPLSWEVVVGLTIAGWTLAAMLLVRKGRHIVYWL
ncbi:MAG TPA: ABC transporter permease [Steroidobacteraceae bacterium]|jgi:ABC-type polysaccharide/polyol phosphate export permease